MEDRNKRLLWCLAAGLALASLAFSLHGMSEILSAGLWWKALFAPDASDLGQLTVHYSILPRIAAALLVGAGLGLAGAILQLVLRNAAAEPATLGIAAGAFLALSAASMLMPAFAGANRTAIAFAGALIAGLAVVGMTWRGRFSPQTTLVAGLVIGLYAGAANTLLIMLHGGLITLFIWGSGSLATQDWQTVFYLAPRLVPALVLSLLMVRPIAVLAVSDEAASSLGVSPGAMRLAGLSVALWITAVCVAAVGVIGFVGLAAPEIVRRLGYHRVGSQFLLSPMIGGLLLWLTDQAFRTIFGGIEIPAGAATALLGAPLLVWLVMQRSMKRHLPPRSFVARRRRAGVHPGWLVGLVLLTVIASLLVGRGLHGWNISGLSTWEATLFWRGPRMLAAGAGAILLAVSGCIIQRLTANPLAGPEILGVSSGAACGAVVAIMLPDGAQPLAPVLSMAGAGIALILLLAMAQRRSFEAHDLFVVGMATATAFSALVSIVLASGDPRVFDLLRWLSGSTFLAQPRDVVLLTAAVGVMAAILPLLARWLELLPLGQGMAMEVGMPVKGSRVILLAFASGLVGLSVLTIGPLSFVGLMAPHLARMLGFRRPIGEFSAAAAIGCQLMIAADWLGRVVMFPNQIPAGLIASLIAPLCFLVLAWRAAD
ncbi:hypothetical protein BA190_08825 [Labrys sp. WJW]|uniref:Fe(3+)-hydroxamate ABC transporter permease FhuB n=1 Tax=Labrys sp. WJW TaxID=1737983 RepID=UPI00082BD5DB|nr:Fe(3+)-hydroxamate ABC transporter permease FhuB [Labrys sp. WJW]OCC05501.1 hypothetical protein BA190_08825 [Labrys sp. WJW]